MPTRHGDLAVLDDPVAQRLLQSAFPAQLSYTWDDGTRRSVPTGFHWNGSEFVLEVPPDAREMTALHDGACVTLTIDSDTMPYKVLLIRGPVQVDTVDGIAPQFEAMLLTPDWVDILGFTTRCPSAAERIMERAQLQTHVGV